MISLIATDMDGTLLDSQKRLPNDFENVLGALRAQGVCFAIASGRSYSALRRDLATVADKVLFICENGALVMQAEKQLLIDPLDPRHLPDILRAAHALSDVYPIVCCAEEAFVESTCDPEFIAETKLYYPSLHVVETIDECFSRTDVCKVALYDRYDAQTHELPHLQAALGDRLSVILSGEHWVDIMTPGVHKGSAIIRLQKQMGLSREACMAFGDYLNDLEMLHAVGESYAMENAHPQLKAAARYIAPSNDDDGVMRVIRRRFSL